MALEVHEIKKREGKNVVYDISLDGSVVNALGGNVISNTDGFNFRYPEESKLRYNDKHPYVSNGKGRNTKEGKSYTGVAADVAEFEDTYLFETYNGSKSQKMGLGIDEYVSASINFSRKNYADFFPDGSVKLVGNTVKSRKLSGYIENFMDKAIMMLLRNNGKEFLELYYEYIDKIYNYRIPLRDIASKGKIKKSLEEYKKDCKTLTKAGTKKSRQAWYELCIREQEENPEFKVNNDDTIYFINVGSKKSESDVKRVTHQFIKEDGKIVELDSKRKREILKEYCEKNSREYKTLKTKEAKEILKPYIVKEEDEIILNCKMIPLSVIEADKDIFCNDEIEYNVVKYIEQFNSRIKALLVCFHPDIRDKILIKNPDDRYFFTDDQCKLVSGFPTKETDQDTFEALMTPERKEIEFWVKNGKTPPFIEPCDINWKKLVDDYMETKKKEDDETFKEEDAKYLKAISELTKDDYDAFEEEGLVPKAISDICDIDSTMHFVFKKLPNMHPSTGGHVFDDLSFDSYSFLDAGETEMEKMVEVMNSSET